MKTVAVVGGSGFVGRSVVARLEKRGWHVRPVQAPRLRVGEADAMEHARRHPEIVAALAQKLDGCDIVVNCAGDSDASSRDTMTLFGANGALPGVVAAAAHHAGASRFVHVSSAAVQGGVHRLDDSVVTKAPSIYSQSKVCGELSVGVADAPPSTVIYRPPSVHSSERRVTRAVRRLATSPLASVAGCGDAPTPQSHIINVGDAIAELATTTQAPPRIVIHPWEGWTTAELMRVFGNGREPLHIPNQIAAPLRWVLRLLARSTRLAPNARRVELMWFGQEQADSWLTKHGWRPPADRSTWHELLDSIDNVIGVRDDYPTTEGSDD